MAVEDLLINTGVDNLIRLIHDAGRIELKDAAKNLGLSTASVEEWSRVLEEEGIVKLEYQLTKIYLVWVGSSPKELARKSEQLADRRAELEKELETMIGKLEARGDELDSLEKDFRKVSDLLDPKFGGVKRKLDALKEIEEEKDKLFETHVQRMSKAKEEYRKLNETLSGDEERARATSKSLHEVQTQIEKIEPELAALGPMKKNITELVGALSTQSKEISDALSTHKSQLESIETISKELNQRHNLVGQMEERIGQIGADIQQLIKALEVLSEEAEKQKKAQITMDGMRRRIEDFESQRVELEQLHESVNKESREVMQRAGGVLKVLDELEDKFKDVKRLEGTKATPVEEYLQRISEIREKTQTDLKELSSFDAKAMSDIAKAKASLEKQLSEMKDLTKSFEGVAEKKREVDAVCAKIDELQEDRRKLFSQLTLLSKEIEVINIQSSPAGSPKKDLQVDELMNKIESVKRDQAEFDKRRTELRGMIEKMIGSQKGKKDK